LQHNPTEGSAFPLLFIITIFIFFKKHIGILLDFLGSRINPKGRRSRRRSTRRRKERKKESKKERKSPTIAHTLTTRLSRNLAFIFIILVLPCALLPPHSAPSFLLRSLTRRNSNMGIKSRVLIIGATGYIGKHVARASVAEGHPTSILIRPSTLTTKAELVASFKDLGITFVEVYDAHTDT
jgi:hypothetical protein